MFFKGLRFFVNRQFVLIGRRGSVANSASQNTKSPGCTSSTPSSDSRDTSLARRRTSSRRASARTSSPPSSTSTAAPQMTRSGRCNNCCVCVFANFANSCFFFCSYSYPLHVILECVLGLRLKVINQTLRWVSGSGSESTNCSRLKANWVAVCVGVWFVKDFDGWTWRSMMFYCSGPSLGPFFPPSCVMRAFRVSHSRQIIRMQLQRCEYIGLFAFRARSCGFLISGKRTLSSRVTSSNPC